MKKNLLPPILFLAILALLIATLTASPALAQSDQLVLSLNRLFGYSSGIGNNNAQIQGSFNASVSGPANLVKVVFYIDGTVMGEDSQAPFKLQFNTDTYPKGKHTFTAVGTTADGQELKSNPVNTEIVSAEEGLKAAGKIAGPLLGIVLVIILVTSGASLLSARGLKNTPLGQPRNYGIAGGTICSRCGRPHPLNAFSPHIGLGAKLDHCPFCGKWSLARRKPLEALRAAEAAELKEAEPEVQMESEDDKLRRELEESKYKEF